MPWKLAAPSPLERENDALKTAIVSLRRELTDKEGHVDRLKFLLRERLTRIDELNGKLEQSRQQVQRLDLQNEILIEMIASPPLDGAMLAAK
jgi:hypothetical protein